MWKHVISWYWLKKCDLAQYYNELRLILSFKSPKKYRSLKRIACYDSERTGRLSLGTNNYEEFTMLKTNRRKFWLIIQTFETCNEPLMAVYAYKHCQSVQTIEIYLVSPTEVSLIDYVKTCNKLVLTKKNCDFAQYNNELRLILSFKSPQKYRRLKRIISLLWQWKHRKIVIRHKQL